MAIQDPRNLDSTVPTYSSSTDPIKRLEEATKRKKTEKIIESFKKQYKEGITFGEKEAPLPGDKKEEVISKLKDKKDNKEDKEDDKKKTFTSSDSSDPTISALENISSMSQITDNEFAMAGAALLGVMQSEQKRKQSNLELEGLKGTAAFKGGTYKADLYSKLADSMKGMLR